MKKIEGTPKTLRELFTGVKYTIHYYQREYMWGKKQIEELIEDLTSEFLEYYSEEDSLKDVSYYGHYFMGSIVLTDNENAIIDGQQRLTSLTLLLIYLYHNLKDSEEKAEILNLFYFKKSGEKSFNLNVEERDECLKALKNDEPFDTIDKPESVRNIYRNYKYIEEIFPEDVKGHALLFFKDWLLDNLDFIRIITQTEQDAHKIFVSMNDRGLSLTETEMLKGYLLSEIKEDKERNKCNDMWKQTILSLKELDKDNDLTFIKNWLRAQFATSIRDTKKDAVPGDFDIIGSAFHKWVRENCSKIGLYKSENYEFFIKNDFIKFSKVYQRLLKYSTEFEKEYEYVYYNANNNFTLQYQLILASIDPKDTEEIINKKIKLVSCFVDRFVISRVLNFKTVDYSAIKNRVFDLTQQIRRLPLKKLGEYLYNYLNKSEFKVNEGARWFYLNGFTKRYMLNIISRMTNFVDQEIGLQCSFEDYVSRDTKNPCDIEHIIADHFNQHTEEFKSEESFQKYRNKFGSLLILPRDKNRSYKDKVYEEKKEMYFSENILARSLNEKCYQNNPQFLKFIDKYNLEFRPIEHFTKEAIQERQELYTELAEIIWNNEKLLELKQ
ncbi:MAG: DUF262 domain-containing protein [Methanosarcina vacuolata]|jgi:uncharacterized protein with ParB-like and HNH nuclease domain|nr:DUF262 domain-containing protein [Methanosarcina vacuolata]